MTIPPSTDPGYKILADLEKPYTPATEFTNSSPTELEVGAGRGDFAVAFAAANPAINMICVERKINYLKRGITKARMAELENIRFLNVEVVHFLTEYITPASLAAVHMYFPDPWPKKRHQKRRTLQSSFVRLVASRLSPGGFLHLRTDHANYFEHMMEVMGAQDLFISIPPPADLLAHKTAFQTRFEAEGLPIYVASYQLRP